MSCLLRVLLLLVSIIVWCIMIVFIILIKYPVYMLMYTCDKITDAFDWYDKWYMRVYKGLK
jgi:hypothetical protein